MRLTDTGLNSTAIGATTASTGSFTTVAASGITTLTAALNTNSTITATANNIKAFVGTTGAGTGFAYGTYESNGGAQYGRVGIEGSSGGTLLSGTGAYDFIVGSISGSTWIGAGGAGIAKISGTGLAVTGALSATGIISQTPNAGDPSYKLELVSAYNGVDSFRLKFAGTTYLRVNTNDGVLLAPSSLAVTGALSSTVGLTLNDGSNNSPNINFQTTSGTRIMDMDGSTVRILNLAATGAALQLTNTGNLTIDGALATNNTVNTVSPTSPNRTITMVIGGTTYYIHAKTTND
jgi:hypothetical protein